MRVSIDECVPQQIRRRLPGHDAWTVLKMGWSGKKNGALIKLMVAGGFVVLLTVDQSLPYQQNLITAGIAVIVMISSGNREADLVPLMPQVLVVLDTIQPGDVVEVDASGQRPANLP